MNGTWDRCVLLGWFDADTCEKDRLAFSIGLELTLDVCSQSVDEEAGARTLDPGQLRRGQVANDRYPGDVDLRRQSSGVRTCCGESM